MITRHVTSKGKFKNNAISRQLLIVSPALKGAFPNDRATKISEKVLSLVSIIIGRGKDFLGFNKTKFFKRV